MPTDPTKPAASRPLRSGHDLTGGSLPSHLLRMTGAGSLAMLAIWSYLFAEVLTATRLAGASAASGIAIGGLCFGLALSLAFAWTAVTTAAIGRLVGMRRHSDAKAVAMLAVVVGAAGSLASGLLLFLLQDAIATHFLGDDAAARRVFADYMRFACLAIGPSALAITANGAQRAFGDARNPMLTNLGATLAGLLGLATIVPALDATGTAFGAVLLLNRLTMMSIALRKIGVFRDPGRRLFDPLAWRECVGILRVVPAQLFVNLAPSLSNAALLTLAAKGGAPLVAALSLVNRTDSLLGAPLLAFQGSVAPIAAQNAGAGRFDRVGRLLGLVTLLATAYALGIWGLSQAAVALEPQWLPAGTKLDLRLVLHYLNWALPCMALTGIVVAASSILIALRRASWASGLAVLRAAASVLLAYAAWPLVGLAALLLAPILATALVAVLGALALRLEIPARSRA
jgi:Na+-driven multidrug efflux pump